MKLQTCGLTLFVFLIYSLCACSDDKIGGDTLDGSCSIALRLKTDHVVNLPLSRAGTEIAQEDLKVRIENTRAEILKTWDYTDLPSLIRVNPGSYKMVAWHGTDSIYPQFDSPFYYGEVKLKMNEGDKIDTTMTCASNAVQVSVSFDNSFMYDYDDYGVDIKTEGDSLHFANGETRIGYFKPGKLRLRFILKPKGKEQYYEFYPPAVATAKAKEWYKMTLKANNNNGALESITIVTDTTTIQIPVNEELSPIFLPKKAPTVIPQGFISGDKIVSSEGLSKQAIVMIQATGGLTSLVLKTGSTSLLEQGWPAELDLMQATAEQQALLKNAGLEWSPEINSQKDIKKLIYVNFDNVISHIDVPVDKVSNASFELIAKDKFEQVGPECKLNIEVGPPIFDFKGGAPVEGDVWSNKGVFELDCQVDRPNYLPTVEYKNTNNEWVDAATISKTMAGVQATITGLEPVTNYTFRARLGKYTTREYTFTTEEKKQIPNSGFEEFYNEEVWKKGGSIIGGQSIHAFYPYKNGETDIWWNTRNRTTTQALADYSWYYAAFPGTVPTDQGSWTAAWHWNTHGGQKLPTNSYSGNRSMQIATVGWGKNNWTNFNHGTAYKTAGLLYIGSYDLGNHSETYGHTFASRPLGVNFTYWFYSYNYETTKAEVSVYDAQNNLIGSGEYKIAFSTNVYTNVSMPIVYTDSRTRAAKITIIFMSTDAVSPETKDIQGSSGAFGGYGDSRHVGSILTVDEVVLKY